MKNELNPDYMFSTFSTELLLKIANGKIDAKKFAKKEIANRGLDKNGQWAGFDNAEKIWK